MKLQLLDKAILRVPQFSTDAELTASWEWLKTSIKISSHEFYELIKDVSSHEIDQLSPAVSNTIWKYFNRAKYRATPYGSFAGIGMINISGPGEEQAIINPNQIQHSLIDWSYKKNITISIEALIENDGYLVANNSHYTVLDAIRYLSYIHNKFELSEVENYPSVIKILDSCKQPVKAFDLKEILKKDFSDLSDLYESLNYLIELQLLFTSLHPNIIGQDYFERLGVRNLSSLPQYVISEREVISSAIQSGPFKALPALAQILQQVSPENHNWHLDKFIADFTQKFELQEISLMTTLDPEIGIGYGEMEQGGLETQDLVTEFAIQKTRINEKMPPGELKEFLNREILSANIEQTSSIDLEKLNFNKNQKTKLPNTFSAILTDADGMCCLENFGGATANSLSGRFSAMNDDVTDYCKNVAQLEQEANPEVLFFDIAYAAENDVDNINRRASIYNYQLSILNYDASADPLKLDDLYLSVFKGKLILRSKRLNKRLIPRLASAYNYGRSDLAVFRLLCDLQNQSLTTNLMFNIRQIIPGLNYYPRVHYKNIIVSRAKWQLSYEAVLKQTDVGDLQCFYKYLAERKVSSYFRTGSADQTLLFGLSDERSIEMLLDYLRKKKSIVIEEAFEINKPLVIDTSGDGYYSEWIVGLYHNEEIYKGRSSAVSIDKDANGIIAPGGKWLYFEIFSHPQRANEILINKVAHLLRLNNDKIHRWFFIRYAENGHHIRFRLLLKDINDTQFIIAALSDSLQTELKSGIVSDFSLRTYKRELARYGYRNIERVELHFHEDSNHVLELIERSIDDYTIYAACSALVFFLRDSMLLDLDSFDKLLVRVSEALNEEHKNDVLAFKKLNAAYKEFKKIPRSVNSEIETTISFHESFLDTLRFCEPESRSQLYTDLMHMHINRLFSTNQRTHEMIFYYFLIKQLEEQRMRRQLLPVYN